MKRNKTLACIALILAVLTLAACASAPPAPTAAPASTPASGAPAPAVTPAPQTAAPAATTAPAPVTPEPKATIKGFAYVNNRLTTAVSNFNEVWCYQEMERQTNVHVDWIHPPVGQEKEQCNLMIASNDLPDFIMMNHTSIGGVSKLLADNVIAPLNEHIDAGKTPGYNSWITKYPEVGKQIKTDEGVIPGFYMLRVRELNGTLGWFTNSGIILRKDWMDKLSLALPTNITELEAVLRAFKDKDPNGNGKADELPYIAQKNVNGLAPAFGVNTDYYELDGKIHFGPEEPRFKDYLETMARWYKDGLIDPDYTTVDAKMYQAKFVENRAGSSHEAAGSTATLYEIMRDTIPDVDFVGIPNLINEADGKAYYTLADLKQSFTNDVSMMTTKCTNIDATLKVLDWTYTPEGYEAFNWGEPNVSYSVKDGVKTFTDEVMNNPKGYPLDRALTMYAMSMCQYSLPKDPDYWVQVTLRHDFQINAIDNWGKFDYAIAVPPISRTPEEATRYAEIMNEINTYKDEMITKIILGTEPVSKFDEMVATFKKLNIDEATQINQTALDRYNAR